MANFQRYKKKKKRGIVLTRMREILGVLNEIKVMFSSVVSGMKQLVEILEDEDKTKHS